jgi:hypothetical protein
MSHGVNKQQSFAQCPHEVVHADTKGTHDRIPSNLAILGHQTPICANLWESIPELVNGGQAETYIQQDDQRLYASEH